MQSFDRSRVPVPSVFGSARAQRYRKDFAQFFLSDHEKRAQTRPPYPDRWIFSSEVLAVLGDLFRGKCAYCEQRYPTDIDHFRPKAAPAVPKEAAETSHLYYAWLAGAWDNLYPACRMCNVIKRNAFPVEGKRMALPTAARILDYVARGDGVWGRLGKEDNLLLDPCRDSDFHKHFKASMSGMLSGVGPRGRATIELLMLNRPDLLERRAKAMALYAETLRSSSASRRDTEALRQDIFDFQVMEFGGFWYLLLREFSAGLISEEEHAKWLSPENIGSFLAGQRKIDYGPLFAGGQQGEAEPAPWVPTFRHIRQVHIKNFKAIENVTLKMVQSASDEFRPPSLLILGENSAGKSSILEAIALTLCGAQECEALGLAIGELMLNDEFLGGAADVLRPATISVEFDDGTTATFNAGRDGASSEGPPARVAVFAYGAFRQYRPGTRSAPAPAPASASIPKQIASLFESTAIQANPEAWLLGLPKSDFYQVVRALREIFSIEREFEIILRDEKNARCLLVNGPDADAGKTPLSLASSGFRSILGMVCEVMQGLLQAQRTEPALSLDTIPAVVLIDEIEAHLHPRWKMKIMSSLRKALPSVTFIATTHDPLCLRGMENGEAVVVRRIRQGKAGKRRLPERVELLDKLPDLTHLSIEQLLTSDFFGLASTDDPGFEQQLEEYADLLAQAQHGGVGEETRARFGPIEQALAGLPIGGNAVELVVEKAILAYLVDRRQASLAELQNLDKTVRDAIADALEGI